MAVGLKKASNLLPVDGIKLASTYSGIRKQKKDDLVLFEIEQGSSVAATFTLNKMCAAPVLLAKKHLAIQAPKYLLVNAGNANAGTGSAGYDDAVLSCDYLAKHFDSASIESVLPFSTGVIGERLPIDKIKNSLSSLEENLSSDNWLAAAEGIMTTDTLAKGYSQKIALGGNSYTVTGMSKGSGMICPNMATMLAYIGTDLPIEQSRLNKIHVDLVNKSFNLITVDGDTSTNDACVLIATNKGNALASGVTDGDIFDALLPCYQDLAQAIVRDGEGATKFVTIRVESAHDDSEAKEVAYTIAHSPLVKTALFASDANWGRILAAVGRSKVEYLDVDKVDLAINGVQLLNKGQISPTYTEEQGAAEMLKTEIELSVQLNIGSGKAVVWTTDLSHDYVSINADYRS